MRVTAVADEGFSIHYRWLQISQTEQGGYTETEIPGANDSSYTAVDVSASGEYACIVTDDYGNRIDCHFTVQIENHFRAVSERSGQNYDTVYVEKDGDTTLSVSASADRGGFEYTWYCNNRLLPNETAKSLTISSVTESQDYSCYVTDIYGSNLYVFFSVRLENHFRAVVRGTDRTYAELSVKPNDSIIMAVDASADEGELHYQWAGNWQDLPGETQDSLTVSGVQANDFYSCRVWDDFGNSQIIQFQIRIDNGFYAWVKGTSRTYADVQASYGASATLSVDAHADVGDLQYVWSCQGEELAGETGPDLVLGSVVRKASYECRVSDDYGNTRWIYFYVSVQNHLEAYVKGYPGRTYISIGLVPNGSTVLEVAASSDDNDLRYEWFYSDDNQRPSTIEGETGSSISVTGVTGRCTFDCFVSDRYQNSVRVSFEVYIENHFRAWCSNTGTLSETVYADYGQKVQLQASASADAGAIRFLWTDPHGQEFGTEQMSGVTIGPVTERGYYMCTVTDQYGSTVTLQFELRMKDTISVRAVTPTVQYVPYDGSANLAVEVTPEDTPVTCTWYGPETVEPESGASLQVDHVRCRATYTCYVTDSTGQGYNVSFLVNVQNNFNAHVTGKGQNVTYDEVFVEKGASAFLSVTATADSGECTYAWYRSGRQMGPGGYETLGNEPTLLVENVEAAGQYQCIVTDIYGTSVTVTFFVSIQNHLTAVDRETKLGLVKKTADYGQSVSMTVDAAADEPEGLTWQWFLMHNGTPQKIQNAEGNSYTTPGLTESRIYFCQVTDRYGFSRTVRYELTVKEQEQIQFRPTLAMDAFTGINIYVTLPEGADPADYTFAAEPHNSNYPGETTRMSMAGMRPTASGEYRWTG